MADQGEEDLFYPKVSKPLVWVVILVAVIFGATFARLAAKTYPRIDGIMAGSIVLAIAFFLAAWRVYCFMLFPRAGVSDRGIRVNGVFGYRLFDFADVSEFARYTKVLKGYHTEDRKIPNRYFSCFVIRLRDRSEKRFILPRFVGEKDLIEAVEMRSRRRVTVLPDVVK